MMMMMTHMTVPSYTTQRCDLPMEAGTTAGRRWAGLFGGLANEILPVLHIYIRRGPEHHILYYRGWTEMYTQHKSHIRLLRLK
jgi:hypothetical protein